jgi:hypothetical protein
MGRMTRREREAVERKCDRCGFETSKGGID